MAPTRRANQADIAGRLRVSVSTVSRALANEIGISPAVRQDVQRMARTLGYKSKHAAGIITDKRAVALMPLGSATSGLSGFYFGIVEGMKTAAAEAGMLLAATARSRRIFPVSGLTICRSPAWQRRA